MMPDERLLLPSFAGLAGHKSQKTNLKLRPTTGSAACDA